MGSWRLAVGGWQWEEGRALHTAYRILPTENWQFVVPAAQCLRAKLRPTTKNAGWNYTPALSTFASLTGIHFEGPASFVVALSATAVLQCAAAGLG